MVDLIMQFFLEQGYLTIDPKSTKTNSEQDAGLVMVKIPNETIMEQFRKDLTMFYTSIGESKLQQRDECVKSMSGVFEKLDSGDNNIHHELATYFSHLKEFWCTVYEKNKPQHNNVRSVFVCCVLLSCSYQGMRIAIDKPAFDVQLNKGNYFYVDNAGVFDCQHNSVGFVCQFKVDSTAPAAAKQIFDRGYLNNVKEYADLKKISKLLVLAVDLSEKPEGLRFDIKYGVTSLAEVDQLTIGHMKSMEVWK